jgi:predicted nucleic acid-binding protein
MALNITIDTNVIIDALQKREPWRESAENIILLAASKKISAGVSASTITNIYYITSRKSGKALACDAISRLAKLLDFIAVDKSDCLKALSSGIDDYEDALLSVCAAKAKSKYIITRNVKDFANSKVPPITPDDFLKQILF